MSTPAVVYLGGGRVDHFITGDDAQLYHSWWNPDDGWVGWECLGGQLVGSPGASGIGENGMALRIDVSGRGTDGGLWHIYYDGTTGGWSPWGPVLEWAPC